MWRRAATKVKDLQSSAMTHWMPRYGEDCRMPSHFRACMRSCRAKTSSDNVVFKAWNRVALERLEPEPYFVTITSGPLCQYLNGIFAYDVASDKFTWTPQHYNIHDIEHRVDTFLAPFEVEGLSSETIRTSREIRLPSIFTQISSMRYLLHFQLQECGWARQPVVWSLILLNFLTPSSSSLRTKPWWRSSTTPRLGHGAETILLRQCGQVFIEIHGMFNLRVRQWLHVHFPGDPYGVAVLHCEWPVDYSERAEDDSV